MGVKRGRPAYLGLDLGGTKSAALLLAASGVVLAREAFATLPAQRGPREILEQAVGLLRGLAGRARADGLSVLGVGVSVGGPLDRERGVVLGPPNLPGWGRVPVAAQLRRGLGQPGLAVVVEHDAKACALAEWLFGAGTRRGRRVGNMAYLTFGTGMGAGLILDGRLYLGASGQSGELGHWGLFPGGPAGYGKEGSFEGSCSGPGLGRLYEQLVGPAAREWTPARIADAARLGEAQALEAVSLLAARLGHGIALLADLLNLELVVLGSLGLRMKDLLFPAVVRAVAAEALPRNARDLRVLPSRLGERVQDLAPLAALLYREKILGRTR